MRVIEERCPFSDVTMAKSKKRASKRAAAAQSQQLQQHGSDDRDSDGDVVKRRSCAHIAKSIHVADVQRAVKKVSSLQCAGCLKDENVTDADSVTWICLRCGSQGCGPSSNYQQASNYQHAVQHWQTPRSDQHNLALNTSTWTTWCYECKEEITDYNSCQLKQVVSLLQKQFGVQKQSRPNSSENLPDVVTTTTTAATVYKRKETSLVKPGPKLKGLSNLGNTCYFNAVIQSLSQVKELAQLLDEKQNEITLHLPGYELVHSFGSDYDDSEADDGKPDELGPLSIQLGNGQTKLTSSMAKLFKDMAAEDVPKQTVNPSHLFNQMKAKFEEYQQQDSHELLRILLDILRTEELTRIKVGLATEFNFRNLDEQAKKKVMPKIRRYAQQAKHTSVDSLFGGYLLCSVLCMECEKASQKFEPFLDLSLPVYEEKGKHLSARRGSRSVADNMVPVEDRRGPSKHQRKKDRRYGKNRRAKNTGVERDANPLKETTTPLDTATSSTDEKAPAGSEVSAVGGEGGATRAERRRSSAENFSDSLTAGSRSATPKSELGYNSDSEDSMETSQSGSLTHDLDELALADARTAADPALYHKIRTAVDMSLETLSDKLGCAANDCSIVSSLGQFTYPELLSGANKFACPVCNRRARKKATSTNEKVKTVYTNATKRMLIYSPPAILTLHLKRFQQSGYSLSKVNRHVEFTVNLNLASYCSKLAQGVEPGQTCVKYTLFAVVEHSGRLNSGHYTAYVRHRTSATLHKTMLQKSLYNQRPLTVLLDRMSVVQKELTSRECLDRNESQSSASAVNGDHVEVNTQARWYHISDTHVKEVSESSVLKSQAYLLFYERDL